MRTLGESLTFPSSPDLSQNHEVGQIRPPDSSGQVIFCASELPVRCRRYLAAPCEVGKPARYVRQLDRIREARCAQSIEGSESRDNITHMRTRRNVEAYVAISCALSSFLLGFTDSDFAVVKLMAKFGLGVFGLSAVCGEAVIIKNMYMHVMRRQEHASPRNNDCVGPITSL